MVAATRLKVTTRTPRMTWRNPSTSRTCSHVLRLRSRVRLRDGREVNERLESLQDGMADRNRDGKERPKERGNAGTGTALRLPGGGSDAARGRGGSVGRCGSSAPSAHRTAERAQSPALGVPSSSSSSSISGRGGVIAGVGGRCRLGLTRTVPRGRAGGALRAALSSEHPPTAARRSEREEKEERKEPDPPPPPLRSHRVLRRCLPAAVTPPLPPPAGGDALPAGCGAENRRASPPPPNQPTHTHPKPTQPPPPPGRTELRPRPMRRGRAGSPGSPGGADNGGRPSAERREL